MPSPKKRQLASITFHATGVPTSYSIAVAWRDGTGETLEFTPGGPALGAKGRKVGVGTEFPGTLEGFLFLLLMALQRERTPLAPHIGQPRPRYI